MKSCSDRYRESNHRWLITTFQSVDAKAFRTNFYPRVWFICRWNLWSFIKIFQLTALIKKSCLQTLRKRTSACFIIIHPRIALHESFSFRRDEWIRWKRFAKLFFYFSSLFACESHNEWVSSSAPRTVLTGLVSLITEVAAIAWLKQVEGLAHIKDIIR